MNSNLLRWEPALSQILVSEFLPGGSCSWRKAAASLQRPRTFAPGTLGTRDGTRAHIAGILERRACKDRGLAAARVYSSLSGHLLSNRSEFWSFRFSDVSNILDASLAFASREEISEGAQLLLQTASFLSHFSAEIKNR